MRLFAGALSRAYARPGDDPVRLQGGIAAWRRDLLGGLGPRMQTAADWDEAAPAHAVADLDAAGWPALRLFALYAERTDLELPDTVPEPLELDRVWRAAADQRFARSLYGHLLACTLWLPGSFPLTLRAPFPDGSEGEIGSAVLLHDQLRFLNARTFAADAAAIADWQALPAPRGGDLLTAARRGFAGAWSAAAFAAAHRLPLRLHA